MSYIRLIKTNPKENQYRFYSTYVMQSVFGEWLLVKEYGRIGSPGTIRNEWYTNLNEAELAQKMLIRKKMKRGYS